MALEVNHWDLSPVNFGIQHDSPWRDRLDVFFKVGPLGIGDFYDGDFQIEIMSVKIAGWKFAGWEMP